MTIIIDTPVLVVVGPTAIGKTALSLEIAKRFNFEIISMDSMQIYRDMDIGTAKVSMEERKIVPHHLIDIIDPDEDYDAASFCRDTHKAIKKIAERKAIPFITGGTGLYLKALIEGLFPDAPYDQEVRESLKKRLKEEGAAQLYRELASIDPVTAKRIHPNDTHRLLRGLEIYKITGNSWSSYLERQSMQEKEYQFKKILLFGLTIDRNILYKRINYRSKMMLSRGLEEEVINLRKRGYSPELKSMQSIGYRHMNAYLDGKYQYDEMAEFLARDTRRYAKRQYTWFNNNEQIQWVNPEKDLDLVLNKTDKWLNKK